MFRCIALQGMSTNEILDKFFKDMDADNNSYIDSTEWLHHLKSKSTNAHRDKASRKLRYIPTMEP